MIRFLVEHRTAANLLMLILIAMGLMSLPGLQRDTFPDFAAQELEIRAIYPGATASEVDETVCQRLMDALDGIESIKEVRAEAREGIGVVTAEMQEGGDLQTFRSDVETEVGAVNDFPEDVEEPVITQLGTTDPVLTILVAGPMSPPDLKAFCEQLKDRIQTLDEVSLVSIDGFSDHQLRIELSPVALMSHGLSVADVADLVSVQSIDLPAGTLETIDTDVVVRFTEQRRTPAELEDLVIVAGQGGAEIKLGDLGRVVDTFETSEDKIELDGQRAGMLRIEKSKDEDTIRVADAIQAFLADERARFPMMRFAITRDNSILVKDRLRMLLKNGWQGMILVFLAMWLFFHLRLSFWVAAGLPVSFLGAMFFLPPMDLTINMLTMVGLLLALGLLMDDAIVLSENVASHLARGEPSHRAAVNGVIEIMPGVLSSFLTTICVLGPLAFLSGDIGKVLRVVPMILIVVLAVSLVEAFWILPAHLSHSLHHYRPDAAGPMRRRIDGAVDWVRERVVGRVVDVLLPWRYLTIGVVIGVFLLSIGMLAGGVLKFQAFPSLDGDVLQTRILLPQGTPLKRTEAVVARVTDAMARVNERFDHQPNDASLVKHAYVQFNQNADAFENGPHVATVTVDLLSAEDRDARIDDVSAAWREEIGTLTDVLSLSILEPTLGPAGRAIEIRFRGDDLGELKAAAFRTNHWLDQFVGVSNLADDLRPGKPELRLRMRPGAFGLRLDAASMSRQLRGVYQGQTAAEIQVGDESYEIDVRVEPSGRDSLGDLDAFMFTLPDGSQVPVEAVATIEEARGWARIARVNGVRTVTLRGDVDEQLANTAEIFATLRKELLPELHADYPDLNVSFEGEVAETGQTQSSMLRALSIGILGVFVLLSFQFRSYIEPLIVMVAIPFAAVGVIWGHLIMGVELSMPSVLGFISLAGVVVNDSILLVMFLKKRRGTGEAVEHAARMASRQRFRAVMITSLTTAAGLLPLLAERSLQAQILIPIAISIVFGLLASTLLVLLVLPCLYTVLDDFGLTARLAATDEDDASDATPST